MAGFPTKRTLRPPQRAMGLLVVATMLLAQPVLRNSADASPPLAPAAILNLVLQPDGITGTDTFVVNRTSAWNFGNNASLLVGRDAVNQSVSRALLQFDLSGLPANAVLQDATLEAYTDRGASGSIQARRAMAPWTEGNGEHSWMRVPVTVRETAGVRRTLEPVGVTIFFPPDSIVDPAKDLRVYSGVTEIPSQVYAYTYSGGRIASAQVWFETTVGAFGTAFFNITYGTQGTSVPAYRTKTLGTTPLWTFGGVGTGTSGATIADLDGDGKLEIIFGTSNGYVYAINSNGATLNTVWGTLVASGQSVPYPPQVADMDRDGKLDVVVLANDPKITRLTYNGQMVWNVSYSVGNIPSAPPTLTDVNGDGVLDVLVSGKFGRVDALDGRDGTSIGSYAAGGATYASSIADVNGDRRGEIFFGSDDRNLYAYEVTGTRLWALPGNTSFLESPPAIGDVNGDGSLEIVAGSDSSSGPEFALRALDGAGVWFQPVSDFLEGGQTLVDLNGDGALDVVTAVYTGGLAYVLNGKTGQPIWTYNIGAQQPLAPAAVDLDKDGKPELVFLDQRTTVTVLNATSSLIRSWTITQNDPGLRTLTQLAIASPAVADVDGDGAMEIIVPTGSGLQAYATGGLGRDWRTWGYNFNHTHQAYDGSSPDGAPLLQVTLGAAQVNPGTGASWDYRDGITRWGARGGDFGVAEANATGTLGWWSWNLTAMVRDWHVGNFPNIGLFLTEADETAGAFHGFHSSDAPNPTLRPQLTITYTIPYQDPAPTIIGAIPNQERAEDSPPWSIDLSTHEFDNDTPSSELRWNLTGYDLTKVQVTGLNTPGGHVLTFYPQKDAWGAMAVTYWLTDSDGHFATRSAWVNLTPVNDPPDFNPPSPLVVRYNQTYTFDFDPYISDVDTLRANLVLTSDDPIGAAVSGFNVSFLYPEQKVNPWKFVTLTVSDGPSATAKVVAVKVTSDLPPVLSRPLPDVTMFEGQTILGIFDLDDYFTDPNNDALFFSFGYTHLNITIHANHSVDIRADAEWDGVERVTFRGTDTQGAIAEDTILVTVLPINDPPVLGPVPDLRVRYDAPYYFILDPYIYDPDTPPDQINVSTSSPYITISGHELALIFPFSLNDTIQDVTIWIGDGTSVVSRTIRVTVGDDWPPYLKTKLLDRTFNEDMALENAYNLAAAFDDRDSSALFYSSGNRSVLVSIDPAGVVNLSALPNWFGTERITFRATDFLGALAEDTVWITVAPVDDAPYFLPIAAQRLNVTTSYLDLRPYLADIDTNLSLLTLSTTNPHAAVLGQGLLLQYDTDVTEEVELTVSDGERIGATNITVIVTLPGLPTAQLPGYIYWIPFPIGAAAFAAFVVYRRRKIEWAFLVTNPGLLVCSMARKQTTELDTDLMTGMLTTIMDFAHQSFSDERQRNLEGLSLGDRQLAIVRGNVSYLAVVYRGRTPGSLLRIMRSLLTLIEAHHRNALGDIIDTSNLGTIPDLLQKLVTYGWWPFVTFSETTGPAASPQ